MKCSIPKSALQGMLGKVQGFTERKSTLPILSHVLMEADDNGLRVKATDLHTSIQVSFACEVEEHGSCAINGKGFFEVVRELPDGMLTIRTEEYTKAHIVSGDIKTHMNLMDPEEYPVVDFTGMETGFSLDPSVLKSMIDSTIFSIPSSSDDDTKYTLAGALLITGTEPDQGGFIEMVTTDSKRLSIARHYLEHTLSMGDGIIVPRKGVHELKRLMDLKEEDSSILLTEDSIFFSSRGTIATVRLIDGKFPDYRGVIGLDGYPIYIRISSAELMNALRVCSAMVSDISNCVRFTFKKGLTMLYAHNPDQGDAEIPVKCSHEGEELEINFNPRYVMDCLSHIDGEAGIRLKSSQGPCLITEEGGGERKWVIMPMRF